MHYVVSFPRLSETDAAALQTFRQQHDPQVDLLAPHVTLAFALPLAESDCTLHVAAVSEQVGACHAKFRHAVVWWLGQGPAHVFLLPDEGLSKLCEWHERLYTRTGPFAQYARYDIPFIPHITLALVHGREAAASLAAEWNADGREISANFDEWVVGALRDDPHSFKPLVKFVLGATS